MNHSCCGILNTICSLCDIIQLLADLNVMISKAITSSENKQKTTTTTKKSTTWMHCWAYLQPWIKKCNGQKHQHDYKPTKLQKERWGTWQIINNSCLSYIMYIIYIVIIIIYKSYNLKQNVFPYVFLITNPNSDWRILPWNWEVLLLDTFAGNKLLPNTIL